MRDAISRPRVSFAQTVLKIASSATRSRKATIREQIDVMRSLGQGAVAWLLGVSVRTVRDTQSIPRNKDGSYDAADVLRWSKDKVESSFSAAGDDPLLVDGGDSPNLERYRAAKADLAEMDAAERRGQLVEIEKFESWWQSEIASPLVKAVELLHAKYGDEAAAIVEGVLQRAEAAIEERAAGNDDD